MTVMRSLCSALWALEKICVVMMTTEQIKASAGEHGKKKIDVRDSDGMIRLDSGAFGVISFYLCVPK